MHWTGSEPLSCGGSGRRGGPCYRLLTGSRTRLGHRGFRCRGGLSWSLMMAHSRLDGPSKLLGPTKAPMSTPSTPGGPGPQVTSYRGTHSLGRSGGSRIDVFSSSSSPVGPGRDSSGRSLAAGTRDLGVCSFTPIPVTPRPGTPLFRVNTRVEVTKHSPLRGEERWDFEATPRTRVVVEVTERHLSRSRLDGVP